VTRKIITFLGKDEYKTTHYTWQGKREFEPTKYFHRALKAHYHDFAVIMLATTEAQASYESEPGEKTDIVTIDEVVSDREMWTAFEVIRKQISPDDQIIFDITHSFRSLPFLALLTLAYLRVVQPFNLEAVVYAPYKNYDQTPVFDLSRFVDLLDWITATNLFLQAGYAEDLVRLLEGATSSEQNAAPDLDKVSRALRLARADEARQSAYAWAHLDIEPEELGEDARPFRLLIKRVQREFKAIAPHLPDTANLEQELQQERALVDWNLDRGQILSAITVAREWLISLFCWLAKWSSMIPNSKTGASGNLEPQWRTEDWRKKAETSLRALVELYHLKPEERNRQAGSKTPPARDLYQTQPDLAIHLGEAWAHINKLRNDLDHAGKIHSTEPRSLADIIKEVEPVKSMLLDLAQQSGLGV